MLDVTLSLRTRVRAFLFHFYFSFAFFFPSFFLSSCFLIVGGFCSNVVCIYVFMYYVSLWNCTARHTTLLAFLVQGQVRGISSPKFGHSCAVCHSCMRRVLWLTLSFFKIKHTAVRLIQMYSLCATLDLWPWVRAPGKRYTSASLCLSFFLFFLRVP